MNADRPKLTCKTLKEQPNGKNSMGMGNEMVNIALSAAVTLLNCGAGCARRLFGADALDRIDYAVKQYDLKNALELLKERAAAHNIALG